MERCISEQASGVSDPGLGDREGTARDGGEGSRGVDGGEGDRHIDSI